MKKIVKKTIEFVKKSIDNRLKNMAVKRANKKWFSRGFPSYVIKLGTRYKVVNADNFNKIRKKVSLKYKTDIDRIWLIKNAVYITPNGRR